uniref:N-terminal methionine N(alpha)-acetyltransferase NatC n=1 Tax=Moina brachiata TaxID=675436 RepID=A0A4Y7NKC6_9CRUS|nr:EOG090X07BN [Moina brachiata]SVE93047.1 EOG090X07BN [Moina brachiata]
MAAKKKHVQLAINHDPSELVACTERIAEKSCETKSKSESNGRVPSTRPESENGHAPGHVNGCNGTRSSSKDDSTATIHTSSPVESSRVESNSSAEVLSVALQKVDLTSDSRDVCDKSEKNEQSSGPKPTQRDLSDQIVYVQYESELQMPDIMRLIQKDLSEPYSIYTYRYFIHNWPMLCFLAMFGEKCVGAIVCKLDLHKKVVRRGYIAMLAVDENFRQCKIGSNLVMRAIRAMVKDGADEVVLETEITNEPALRLYENLGFVRDKRLFRYYLNGVDALRLKLWLR